MAQAAAAKGDGPIETHCKLESTLAPAAQARHPFAVQAALLALRVYKAYLSTLFAGTCRFEPTCSQYAYQAIERFGVLRGIWLGSKRLFRCHPLSGKFGYDPVPDEFHETNSETTQAAEGHALSRTTTAKDGISL